MTDITLGDLRVLMDAYPDAPKWWLGDWMNEGGARFGIGQDEAVELAAVAARSLTPRWHDGSLVLPGNVAVDAASLQFPETMTRDDWVSVGGFLLRLHLDADSAATPRRARFNFGEVLPANDLLSEWLSTIAMAANDLIAVHVQMATTDDPSLRWYFFRAGVGHFYEAAKHLDETEAIPEVQTFVASLHPSAQEAYEGTLSLFRAHRSEIFKLRNGVFHYPSLINRSDPGVLKANRALKGVLEDVASQEGSVRLGALRDARIEFADELTVRLAVRALGSERNFEKLQGVLRDAIQHFVRFMNPAQDEYVSRARERGAVIRYEFDKDTADDET